MKYKDIKDFIQRCEKHPAHQNGMVSYQMIQARLDEEIAELREYIETQLAQEQKPFTYYDPVRDAIRPFPSDGDIPLYTTPPQRTWVGLSDEEAQWLYDNCRTPSNLIDMVEAKLKEKNTK